MTQERVVLANELPFQLGTVRVDPTLRQLSFGHLRLTVEPRAMQVLVLLKKANGRVVPREALIAQCWDGRVVGDDAINHAVAKLRRLADQSDGQFEIETIARVGFRLVEKADAPPGDGPAMAPPEPPVSGVNRRLLFVGAGFLAAGGAAVAFRSAGEDTAELAEDFYQRGLATRGQGYATQYEQAVGYFRRAVEIDPDHAAAWGALSWSYRTLLADGDRPDATKLAALAISAARRALELDGDNPDARLALLLLKPNYQRWAEVEAGCEDLLARHPDHDITLFQLGYIRTQTGRWRESLPPMLALTERQPTWPMAQFRLFEALSSLGRVEEADARIVEAMRLAPRNILFWTARLQQLLLTGRQQEAVALMNDPLAQPNVDFRIISQQQRIVTAFGGSPTDRRAAVENLLREPLAVESELPVHIAVSATMLGEIDTAFALLEGYYLGRGRWASLRNAWPQTNHLFGAAMAPAREDGRFAGLLKATRLESF